MVLHDVTLKTSDSDPLGLMAVLLHSFIFSHHHHHHHLSRIKILYISHSLKVQITRYGIKYLHYILSYLKQISFVVDI